MLDKLCAFAPLRLKPEIMLLKNIYSHLKQTLSESDARYVINKRIGMTHAQLIANPEQDVDESACFSDLARVKAGEPLSRIYGEREFWGLNFKLSPDTLDPRPDTETLIEVVLARYKDNAPKSILDLGTGSGCILLSLLSEYKNAHGLGVDLSEGAVEMARTNAKSLGFQNRATFQQGNWADNIDQRFDLVVSNPPYIASKVIPELDENVQKHDPILALDGGEDGLQAYKIIFSQLFRILNPGGFAYFEIGFDQAESVMRLSEESRFSNARLIPDSAGLPRVVEIFFAP